MEAGSERDQALQDDQWRLVLLIKSLSNPEHPYHRTPHGNMQILQDGLQEQGADICQKFADWYKNHYSANRMKLVVLGSEPLDLLEQWVGELFADLQSKEPPQNHWDSGEPWLSDHLCTEIFAKKMEPGQFLYIMFPFLDEEQLYQSQPSQYISHLIKHKGRGSILVYIKAKGWAKKISASRITICPGCTFFTVSVGLTEKGTEQYHEVVKVIFHYIAMIKERPPEQWIFDKIERQAEAKFRCQKKSSASDFTLDLASRMQRALPRKWLLSGDRLWRKFEPDAIKEAMSYLRADNFRIMVASPGYPGNWDSREERCGTKYKAQKIPEDFLSDIHKVLESSSKERISDLHMPHKTPFSKLAVRLTAQKAVASLGRYSKSIWLAMKLPFDQAKHHLARRRTFEDSNNKPFAEEKALWSTSTL
ncbi:hypothetical protein VTN00DRAFT_2727 [Thermoascus crustaceus]|uniref:uncharacterized protein n=1 Tax=Thermoascus crustaceus TaxID=5088 RepID=UPI0037431BFD